MEEMPFELCLEKEKKTSHAQCLQTSPHTHTGDTQTGDTPHTHTHTSLGGHLWINSLAEVLPNPTP